MKCPVCGSVGVRENFFLEDRFFKVTREKFIPFRCTSCRALFLDQDSVRDRVAEFYPEHYWWSPRGFAGKLEQFYRHWVLRHDHLPFVKNSLKSYTDPDCLEIGCGSGTFTGLVRKEGLEIKGLEISAEAVGEARRQGLDWIEEGSVETALASKQTYDAVILFHVLEHIPDPREFMGRLSRIVRKGGMVILQVPNCGSWQARLLGRRWYGLDCPRHVCNYTREALERLLSASGFKIQEISTFSLRDNAPALVSSLLPGLDPLARRVRSSAEGRRPDQVFGLGVSLLYFGLVLLAQPLAWIESLAGRGATIKLAAVRVDSGEKR